MECINSVKIAFIFNPTTHSPQVNPSKPRASLSLFTYKMFSRSYVPSFHQFLTAKTRHAPVHRNDPSPFPLQPSSKEEVSLGHIFATNRYLLEETPEKVLSRPLQA